MRDMYRETKIKDVKITGGLLYEKRKVAAEKTVPYIKRALNNEIEGIQASGAFENFRAAAGESGENFFGLVSQDSDLFKWMEAASLALQFERDEREIQKANAGGKSEALEGSIKKDLDEAVGLLVKAQQKNGYLNTYYILNGLKDRWHYLKESCQLYCAGHLMEAAVSNYEVTGEKKLLDVAQKYADCIGRAFGTEPGKIRGYDGHAEIEIGLYRLYGATRINRYRKLADFFVEERGQRPCFFAMEKRNGDVSDNLVYELEEADYRHSQSHMPVREQKEAVGHAVKAMYFYTAAAEKAGLNGDEELFQTLKALWDSVTKEKMYLTGAIGASEYGESFSYPFDLPPDLMYGETCASIGLFLFAYRMLLTDVDSCYGDVMERSLYNGILAGMSENGTEFFYTNALEIDPEKCEKRRDHMHQQAERQPWFECPCCPPNIARLLLGLNRYIYTASEECLNIHLFAESTFDAEGWTAEMKTKYPENGYIKLRILKSTRGKGRVKLRIPQWCSGITYIVNGMAVSPLTEKGYAVFLTGEEETMDIEISMPMEPEKIYADARVKDLVGKAAVMRGPVVYCAEEADNGEPAVLFWKDGGRMTWEEPPADEPYAYERIITEGWRLSSGEPGLYTTQPPRFEETRITLVPYYRWNNRGKGAMRVFLNTLFPAAVPGTGDRITGGKV